MDRNNTELDQVDQAVEKAGIWAGLVGNGVMQHNAGYPDSRALHGIEIDPREGGGIHPQQHVDPTGGGIPQGMEVNSMDFNEMAGMDQMAGHSNSLDLSMDYQALLCQTMGSMDFNDSSGLLDSSFSGMFNLSLCNGDLPFEGGTNPEDYDALKEIHFAALVVVLYIIVILVGAIGNIMVVITVVKTKQMWNATNIFIANLAIADVFVCVFDLPLSVYYQITDKWIFGEGLCHVILPALAVVVYDSTLTLTLISIDRYLLIVFPLKRHFTVKIAVILVGIIAVVSLAVASPIALYSKYVKLDDPALNIHRQYCTEEWPSTKSRLIYTIVTLLCQYFLPLLIIGILYYLIFRRVRQRIPTCSSASKTKKKSRKTRTTKMLVAVVTVFAVTWTPFHLYGLITELNYDAVKGRYYKLTDALLRVVAMSSSCINPILYAWLNDNYRNAFISLVKVRGRGAPVSFHKESCESTGRSLMQSGGSSSSSPKRRTNIFRKLTLNGKFNPTTRKVEHVALRDVRNGGQNGALLTPRASQESMASSPLLQHKV